MNNFVTVMGNCICIKKPVLPPNQKLTGQWLLNSKSRYFHIGHGKNRYRKGSNLLGVGLSVSPKQESVCRLIIYEDGMITFYEYTPECWMVLDGPVYSWKNGKIKSISKSVLQYDDSLLESKNMLIINGMALYREQEISEN